MSHRQQVTAFALVAIGLLAVAVALPSTCELGGRRGVWIGGALHVQGC